MRIIHVVQTLDPAAGGPPAVALRLAASQAAQGHEACIAAYSCMSGRDDVAASSDDIPAMGKVRLLDYGSEDIVERLTGWRVSKGLTGMINHGDVVHLHGIWDPILKAAASASLRAGARYVISPHGMLDPWSLGQKYWKKRLALSLRYRSLLDQAAFIHFLNQQEQALTRPLNLQAAAEIIPNGVFINEIDGALNGPAPSSSGDSKPYILFLGRLHYKKGLDVLAGAFEYVARHNGEVDLVVVGPDAGAQREFEARIRAAGLGRRVRLTGPLYGADKYRAYAGATAFCLPSRQEGFSIAVIEALGCGVPVVISRQCNFPEVEVEGVGTVVELDPDQTGRALLGMLGDPVGLRRAGERARALVVSRYTWPGIAQRMVDAYQKYC